VRREALASELAALARGGRLSAKRVVDWARSNRSSTLHRCFEWDNTKAAERYRIWQARELIVSVEVEHVDGSRRQVYVSPISTRSSGRGYHRLVDVLGEADLRRSFLAQALADLERVCEKYHDLCELAGVREAVRLVRNKSARKPAA
jgi:hypothetical protein